MVISQYIEIYIVGSFYILMEKLMACSSSQECLPVPGNGPVKVNALTPEHRALITLRYLATPDLISSLAVAQVLIIKMSVM